MLRKFCIAFSFLSTFFIQSCSQDFKAKNSIVTIDIQANIENMKPVDLSQFASNCWYIILEKVEGRELSGAFRYDISDKYIVVSDFRNCLIYDINGVYISTIGQRGNGPGEYKTITNLHIHDDNIYIQSLYDLNIYNKNGSFIIKHNSRFLINNEYISSWFIMDDSLFFGKINRMSGQEKQKATIFDINGNIKKSYKNYIYLHRLKPLAGPDESEASIFQFQDNIFFKERCNDTLFYLTKDYQLKPLYKFDFGKYAQQFLQGDEDLQSYVSKLNNYIWIENVFQSSAFILLDCNFNKYFPAKRRTSRTVMDGISLNFNTTHALGLYNKQTNDLIFCKPTDTDNPLFTSGLYNDIDAGPRFYPIKQVNDSTLVMWIEAKQLKDHVASMDFIKAEVRSPEKKKELEKLANSLKEIDNPILMLVRLKK
ncbi:MAG: 6-bladed beta-propeller [Bacteroidales bacterium]|nr:6-bladed beta-propeller [Bacteroidales bacterium]